MPRKRINNRAEAAKKKKVFYNTGKPCINGHYADRYVSNSMCTECQRKHARKFHSLHPEKVVKNNRAWVKRNPEKHKEVQRLSKARQRFKKNNPVKTMEVEGGTCVSFVFPGWQIVHGVQARTLKKYRVPYFPVFQDWYSPDYHQPYWVVPKYNGYLVPDAPALKNLWFDFFSYLEERKTLHVD